MPLTITDAAAPDARFHASGLAFPLALAPGTQVEATVAFAPSHLAFGWRHGTFTFTHDGEPDRSDSLAVAGIGVGGWGDGSGDGRVDVEDLLVVVDVVLDRTEAGAAADVLDVHPVDAPDGALTVGDLAVLLQAVAAGETPTGDPLPVPPPALDGAKRGAEVFAQVRLDGGADGRTLALALAVPVRGLQFDLSMPAPATPDLLVDDPGTAARAVYDARYGHLRLVLIRTDGAAFAPGRFDVLRLPAGAAPTLRHAVAVSADGRRGTVEVAEGLTTDAERLVPVRPVVGAPYPNPFRAAGAVLRVPVTPEATARVHAVVFDALGRRTAILEDIRQAGPAEITWDGRDGTGRLVPPGLYVVRVTCGADVVHRTVVVL